MFDDDMHDDVGHAELLNGAYRGGYCDSKGRVLACGKLCSADCKAMYRIIQEHWRHRQMAGSLDATITIPPYNFLHNTPPTKLR